MGPGVTAGYRSADPVGARACGLRVHRAACGISHARPKPFFKPRIFDVDDRSIRVFHRTIRNRISRAAFGTVGARPVSLCGGAASRTTYTAQYRPRSALLSDRVPVRYVATTGALIVAADTFALSRLPAHPSTLEIMLALVLAGCGKSRVFAMRQSCQRV